MAHNFNFHCVFGITNTFRMQEKLSIQAIQSRLDYPFFWKWETVLFTYRRVKLWSNNLRRKKKQRNWGETGKQVYTPYIRIKSGMATLSTEEVFIFWSRRLLLLGCLAKQKQLAAKISSLGRFRSLWSEQFFELELSPGPASNSNQDDKEEIFCATRPLSVRLLWVGSCTVYLVI